MNHNYEHICFEVFSDVPGEPVSPEEKQRLLRPFDQRVSAGGTSNVKGGGRRGRRTGTLIAACMILCLAATPLGDKTWAAVKQAFVGIGQYLGMDQQDDYATVINQTQTKNGVAVTLCEAIGSDHELRIAFRATNDGENIGDSKVDFMESSINGYDWQDGLKSTGTGPFGSDLPKEERDPGMHYWVMTFEDYEMPLNPTIYVKIAACGEEFEFTFTLENEAFKAATKKADIDKTVMYHGKRLILKQLVVTPIDQWITIENPDGLEQQELWCLHLHGSDQSGDPVTFYVGGYTTGFQGFRDNEDAFTYQMNKNAESYTLRVYDDDLMTPETLWCEESALCDEFTIQVKQQ